MSAGAGGPNECKHGYADGIPCPKCDQEKPAEKVEPPTANEGLVEDCRKLCAHNQEDLCPAVLDGPEAQEVCPMFTPIRRNPVPSLPVEPLKEECPHHQIRYIGVEGDIGGRPWKMYQCNSCGRKFDGELI